MIPIYACKGCGKVLPENARDQVCSAVCRERAAKVAAVKAKQPPVPTGWAPPAILPPDWTRLSTAEDGASYRHRRGMVVILSIGLELDETWWLHLSASHPKRIPGWGDMRNAKDIFLGVNAWAYSVLPPRVDYVNIHPNVLHLWSPFDGRPRLPNFTHGTGSL